MPTDFAAPSITDTYVNFLAYMKARDVDTALWFDNTGTLNAPLNAKGWDSANNRFVYYTGSAWLPLAARYGIDVSSVGGYGSGHATGQIPISDGAVNVSLNADKVDGADAGTGAGNVLLLDGAGRAPASILPALGTAGTFTKVTVDATGRVSSGLNPTTIVGYGLTDAAYVNGTNAYGSWAIDITGKATTSGIADQAARWSNPITVTLGQNLRGSASFDGQTAAITLNGQVCFGAQTSAGIPDWNAVQNTYSGFSPRIMPTNDANGPGYGAGVFAHCLNVEYATTNGSGNVTQFAIPYRSDMSDMALRTRYNGTWGAWLYMLTNQNVGNYAAKRDGTNATGKWGISTSGKADTAGRADSAAAADTASSLVANAVTAGAMTVNGAMNVAGQNVVQWPSYGGGWYMLDTIWMRVLNNKNVFTAGLIRGDGGLAVGGTGAFTVDASGNVGAQGKMTAQGTVYGNGGTKGFGKVTTTTTTGMPSGGSAGDFVFVYSAT